MFFTDYKIAAERHLETCLQLQSILEIYKKKEDNGEILTLSEIQSKNDNLSNLYYLAGYIIECIYNCAIYKQIGFPSNVDVMELKPSNWSIHGITHDVSFRARSGGGGPNTFIISQPGHKLSGNMHFFASASHMTLNLSIPLLDGNNITRPCTQLFDNWNAEVRYSIDPIIILNYITVFDFFALANEIYTGLIKNSIV